MQQYSVISISLFAHYGSAYLAESYAVSPACSGEDKASGYTCFRQLCAVSGLPVSAVLRQLISGVTIRQRPPKELHDLYAEINRIGTNINQIARKANAGFATKDDMRELLFLMKAIEQKMAKVAEQ